MAEVDTIDVVDAAAATQTVATQSKVIKTIGVPADAAATATDTTAVTHTSLLKQISKTLQAAVASIAGSLFVRVGDGTNAVKVTDGAPAATDYALAVAIHPDSVNANGQATKANSAPVVPASDWIYNTGYYVTVAASQTASVLQSSSGTTGDYLHGVLVIPATVGAGAGEKTVTILDNATALVTYPGAATTALLTLTPFFIPVGAYSRSGAWKITTGANVSVVAVGRFS